MKEVEKGSYEWLPHLEKSIPEEAFGYTVSMYSVALEGWRRGLTLKFINNNRRKSEIDYSLTYKGVEKRFLVTMGEGVTESAIKICRDKHLAKEYLVKSGVPTPVGDYFKKGTTDAEIIAYANDLGYPLVIKPVKGTGGRGVIANIKNEKEFREALDYVKYDLKYSELIVEKFFAGEDYRVYVMEDKVLAILDRISANIIGDGKQTIRQLLNDKNIERVKVPAFHKRTIKIDKEMHNVLKQAGYTLDSIPPRGERVFLKSKNNISAGGDPIDITEQLSPEIKKVAIDAVKAIPGMTHGGVDIIVNKEKNTGVVLEINSRPSITGSLFPMEGKARNIPKAIIDYYFPETQADYSKPLFYFDFQSMYSSFLKGVAKEFTVPNVPIGELEATRFTVTGNLKRSYANWIRKQATKLGVHGYIKRLDNKTASIIVSGLSESINKFRTYIKSKAPSMIKIDKIEEKTRKNPVKVGFEIIDFDEKESVVERRNIKLPEGYHPIHLEDPKKKKKTKKKRKKSTHSVHIERNLYKEKYEQVINSTSWKATKPLRKLGSIMKKRKGD